MLLSNLGHSSRASVLELTLLAELGTTASRLTTLQSSGTSDSLFIATKVEKLVKMIYGVVFRIVKYFRLESNSEV